ncbi:MAG: diaminopimelate epimerase [Acidimicrobiales bacterium]
MASITLTKHHGLGNDFLIAVEPTADLTAEDAIRWCDRRTGIGADGLIAAVPAGEDPSAWTMTLWNADGSRAELSGNGLRCLGQALLLIRDDGEASKRFTIHTDAGPRPVEVTPDRASDTYQVTVGMGTPADGPAVFDGWADLGVEVIEQRGVDVGNPHLVALVGRTDAIDLGAVGPAVEASYGDGINVEVIEIVDRSTINLRVWERGAGLTEACGTGACAAAFAANRWGRVDDRITVDMPGGSADVELADGTLSLTGPATFVAVVEVERS